MFWSGRFRITQASSSEKDNDSVPGTSIRSRLYRLRGTSSNPDGKLEILLEEELDISTVEIDNTLVMEENDLSEDEDDDHEELCFALITEWIKEHPEASICTNEGAGEFKDIAILQDYRGLPAFKNVRNILS
ncbi:hypothetical protein FRX31_032869 [Thalictrum thalictroides]|uniref:Uncharacterized protein n=1 Tax=Thalictrum thalictroides TaxID=46969 RepID=A0A7J6UY36_THATH|nr:hypothetical protein FRX31_032869 [Thalictrum thalictroides]